MVTIVTRALTSGPIKLGRKRRFNSTQIKNSMKCMHVKIMRKSAFLKLNVLHSEHLLFVLTMLISFILSPYGHMLYMYSKYIVEWKTETEFNWELKTKRPLFKKLPTFSVNNDLFINIDYSISSVYMDLIWRRKNTFVFNRKYCMSFFGKIISVLTKLISAICLQTCPILYFQRSWRKFIWLILLDVGL